MTEIVVAVLVALAAAVLTLTVAPQLAEQFNARRTARDPEPDVELPAMPAAAPMARRYLAPDYRAMSEAMHGRGGAR